jgi:large subunit ribosomal protein L7/L12
MARTRKSTDVKSSASGSGSGVRVSKIGVPPSAPPSYDVVLRDAGPGKLNVVKIVKTILGLGLKEAKDLVEQGGVMKAKVSREEAEVIKAQLVEAGATVEIRVHGATGPADGPWQGPEMPSEPKPKPTASYDVVLRDAGPGKLNVVKIVKTILGLGLKEAKDLVEQGGVMKADVSREEAEAIKAQMVEAGATVEIQAHGATEPEPLPEPTPAPTATGGFDVVLLDAGPGKLNVVKIVKTILGLGLKEAKDLVDQGGVMVTNVSREEAEAIKAQMVEAGATVEIRGDGAPVPKPEPAPNPEPTPSEGFDVVLHDAGPGKLNVVKIVKTILGLGLKEAKDLVDQGGVMVTNVSREMAEAIRAQMVEAGATVEIRDHA